MTSKMEAFSITLPSNVDGPISNRIGDYKTYLPKRIDFENTKWEVALTEISFTKSFYNLLENSTIKIMRNNFTMYDTDGMIRAGHYSSEEEIINSINIKIKEILNSQSILATSKYSTPFIIKQGATHKIVVHPGALITESDENSDVIVEEVIYPIFLGGINNFLGLVSEDPLVDPDQYYIQLVSKKLSNFHGLEKPIVGHRPIDLSGGIANFYVYCNIIKPSIVGNTINKLLRIVHVPKSDFGEQITFSPEHPMYIPIEKDEFDMIEISIKDQTGTVVPFQFGRSIVTLHFRPK